MDEGDWLVERFAAHQTHLRAVAYRMLGSLAEAEDAVQETWLRLHRSDPSGVDNLRGWLTTVIARVCLDMLRSRTSRREEPLSTDLPDSIMSSEDEIDPEHEVLLADSVGLALLVVLDRLAPAERLAFVLHDLFAVPYDQIAALVGRSEAAARQLASRARRRVHGADTISHPDLTRQREAVDAFLTAARGGKLDALLAVLDPDVVLRASTPTGAAIQVSGAPAVGKRALTYSWRGQFTRPALVNGAVGAVVAPRGQLVAALRFTVIAGKIVEIDVIADPARLRQLNLAVHAD